MTQRGQLILASPLALVWFIIVFLVEWKITLLSFQREENVNLFLRIYIGTKP